MSNGANWTELHESSDTDMNGLLCNHKGNRGAFLMKVLMQKDGFSPDEFALGSVFRGCAGLRALEWGKQVHGYVVKSGTEMRSMVRSALANMYMRCKCLEEGERVIREMPVPNVVACNTLIAGMARNGCPEGALEQYNVVKNAGFEPGKITFVSVLSSCSEPATLGQGQQAAAKRWEEVSTMRKAMKDLRVKKEPGVSWFEFRNKVHQFTMGAKTYPRWKEIEFYSKELMSEIKKCGYVPDTASLDMENDKKEQRLAQHSEKLAIAFALMIIPPGFPIRIMKSLRICSDCHIAIKYIAKIRDRETIVRDASRFHHFMDGSCSCGEVW